MISRMIGRLYVAMDLALLAVQWWGIVLALCVLADVAFGEETATSTTWCGLRVEPENRCSPYDARRYRYPADLDRKHVEKRGYRVDADGKLDIPFPSPYVGGIQFRYLQDMDIEHVVPRSEAHDSGMCDRYPTEWSAFASAAVNIVVASEHVNRTLKRDKEPHEWLPDINAARYAWTWVYVKRRYDLSVDPVERDFLERAMGDCEGMEMVDFLRRTLWHVGWAEPRDGEDR